MISNDLTRGPEPVTLSAVSLAVLRFPREVGEVLARFFEECHSGNVTLHFRKGEILGCTEERKISVKPN